MMSGVATDMSSYLLAGLQVSFPLFGLGLILFWATFSAGVYPRWAAALLIVSIPVTIFLDPTPGTLQESIGQILLGAAVAAFGFYASRRAPSIASAREPGAAGPAVGGGERAQPARTGRCLLRDAVPRS